VRHGGPGHSLSFEKVIELSKTKGFLLYCVLIYLQLIHIQLAKFGLKNVHFLCTMNNLIIPWNFGYGQKKKGQKM
jgi:hypothetical protein